MSVRARWGEMAWPDVGQASLERRVVILPVGSVEGHGPHLPVDTDARIVDAVCQRVADAAPDRVVVLPTVWYGICPHHMDFPGSITISETTFIQYVLDVCESVARHGFRRLLLLNGHGGNQSALDLVARMVATRHPGVLCAATAYYVLPQAEAAEARVRDHPTRGSMGHADFSETSLYLAIQPEVVKMGRAVDQPLPAGGFGFAPEDAPVTLMQHWSAITPTGVLGYPTRASVKAGEVMLQGAVEGVIAVVDQLLELSPGPRVDHHPRQGPEEQP